MKLFLLALFLSLVFTSFIIEANTTRITDDGGDSYNKRFEYLVVKQPDLNLIIINIQLLKNLTYKLSMKKIIIYFIYSVLFIFFAWVVVEIKNTLGSDSCYYSGGYPIFYSELSRKVKKCTYDYDEAFRAWNKL